MGLFDWTPYLVGGGTRPDAITGLASPFQNSLSELFQSAPPEIQQSLRVTSGYRSPEVQAGLWDKALAKYGSPEAARKWVAPPGKSNHNHGEAVDFKFLSPEAQQWVHANADKFGLSFPLSNEPWHVEPAGLRGGGGSNTQIGGLSIRPGKAAGTQEDTLQNAPYQGGGLLDQIQTDPRKQKWLNLAASLTGMTMFPNQAIIDQANQGRAIEARNAEYNRQSALEQKKANATAAWIRSQPGGEQFAAAIESGAIPADKAFAAYLSAQKADAPPTTDDIKEYDVAVGQGFKGTLQDWILAQKKAGATSIDLGGGSGKQVFDAVSASAEKALAASNSITAFAEAKKALDGGAITGAGADARLALAKIGALFGADPSQITNTETFRSAVAPIILSTVRSLGAGSGISNADRDFAEKAAGGNINLDETSIKRLMDIGQRAAEATIKRHQAILDKVYPDNGQFDRERALFGIPDVSAPTGKVMRYNPQTGQFE